MRIERILNILFPRNILLALMVRLSRLLKLSKFMSYVGFIGGEKSGANCKWYGAVRMHYSISSRKQHLKIFERKLLKGIL